MDVTYLNGVYTVTQSNPVYTGQNGTLQGGAGSGAIFNVSVLNNVYSVTIDPQAGVSGYSPYDVIQIPGTFLGGTSPNNDAEVTITTVDSEGFPTGASIAGNGANAQNTYTGVTHSTNNAGIGTTLNITTNGTAYQATFSVTGTGFA